MEHNRDVIIEVRGGTVVEVYSDVDGIRTILVDWDECGDEVGTVYPVLPCSDLPDSTRMRCEAARLAHSRSSQ